MASFPDILKSTEIHPVLRSFADEVRAVVVRLMAYTGGLAALAFIAADLFSTVPVIASVEQPAARPGWFEVAKPHPAFAVAQADFGGTPTTYGIRRHPEGGRKDTLVWGMAGENPVAEVEIFRLGGETPENAPPAPDLAIRMGLLAGGEAEAAGIIETKFGPVSLIRFPAQESKTKPCLGFARVFEGARIHITGFTCNADTIAAQRASVGCLLNRLTLLAAGNDSKMAELFARAELKRGTCNPAPVPGDWVSSLQEPQLRGRL
jgi:energy-converting hydrogenase Eha subunit E